MADQFFADVVGSGNPYTPQAPKTADPTKRVVNPGPTLKGTLDKSVDAVLRAGNSAFLAVPKQLAGLRGGVEGMMQGEPFGDSRIEAIGEYEGAMDAAGENLGTLGTMAAEAAGAIPKMSGPGLIQTGVEGMFKAPVITGKGMNSAWNFAKDLLKGGAVGATEGAAVSLVNNIADGDTFMKNAAEIGLDGSLIGFGGGLASQALIGRLLPTALKYGLSPLKIRADQKAGEALLDTGSGALQGEGVTPDTIRREFPRMVEDNVGILTTGAGTSNAADVANRLADTIAETHFPKSSYAHGAVFDDNAEAFLKSMGQVNTIIDDTMGGIRANFRNVLGDARESTQTRGRNINRQLETYKSTYKMLNDPESVVGKQKIPYTETVDGIGAKMAAALNSGKTTGDLGTDAQKVYRTIKHELQPKRVSPHTRQVEVAPDLSTDPVNGIDYSTAQSTLSDLVRARAAVAAKYKPGILLKGTPVSKELAAAGAAALKTIDEEIAARTDGLSTEARAGYARWMQAKDAEETGAMFFSNRLSEDPQFGASMEEYMDKFKDNPKAIEGFKEGYKRAMMKEIEDGAPLAVMYNTVGALPNSQGVRDATMVKSTGLKNMETVLGKETTDKLIQTFADDTELLKAGGKLRGYLEAKQTGKDPVASALRDMDELLIAAGVGPGNAAVLTTSTMGALGRKLKAFGVDEAKVLTEIVGNTGDDAVRSLNRVLNTVETPTRISGGKFGGALSEEDEFDATPEGQSIEEYFRSLGISSPQEP